jgi:hypothetical protein
VKSPPDYVCVPADWGFASAVVQRLLDEEVVRQG